MANKTWIKVRRGLIEEEHRKVIGPAIWYFLHLLDIVNWDTGQIEGYTDQSAADDLEVDSKATVRNWRVRLQNGGYITSKQAFHSLTITIHKWINPREHTGQVYNNGDKKTTPLDDAHGDKTEPLPDAHGESFDSPYPARKLITPPLDSQLKDSQLKDSHDDEGDGDNHQALFEAVMDATAMDPKIRSNAGRIAKTAKSLRKAGYTSAQIRAWYVEERCWWYQMDWRGKKQEIPTLAQIVETVGKAKRWSLMRAGNGTGSKPSKAELQAQVDAARAEVEVDDD